MRQAIGLMLGFLRFTWAFDCSDPNATCLGYFVPLTVPLCGSDGKTYTNECLFEAAKCSNPFLSRRPDSDCRLSSPSSSCDQRCPRQNKPVCGSDGITYSNWCTLSIAQCQDPTLTKVNDGRCKKKECQTLNDAGECCEKECSKEYQPVCGSDGVTYANTCRLGNAKCTNVNLALLNDGECTMCERNCMKKIRPVCGSDGTTYTNLCLLQNAQCTNKALTKQSDGDCPPPVPGCVDQVCPDVDLPVCGSNGKTYLNMCVFSNAQCHDPTLELISVDACAPPIASSNVPPTSFPSTTTTIVPIISPTNVVPSPPPSSAPPGVVSTTIASIPSTIDESTPPPITSTDSSSTPAIATSTPSVAPASSDPPTSNQDSSPSPTTNPTLPEFDCKSNLICPTEYAPVCGSDGTTYSNACRLAVAQCLDPLLTKVRDGECCETVCTKDFKPVCGSDGVTYSNLCRFANAKCTNAELTMLYGGECARCERICVREYKPVCGSDGTTYASLCMLQNAQCTDKSLIKQSDGECPAAFNCDAQVCPDIYSPVCGSNDRTYPNMCVFNLARCRDAELTVKQQSSCGPGTTENSPVCGTMRCVQHTRCVTPANGQAPFCADVCDDGRCRPNELCKLVPMPCVAAPCPPVANCSASV